MCTLRLTASLTPRINDTLAQGMYGEGCSEMLTVQYRMNSAIMTWSSDALYQVGRYRGARVTSDKSLPAAEIGVGLQLS
jgi:hypothetical protein